MRNRRRSSEIEGLGWDEVEAGAMYCDVLMQRLVHDRAVWKIVILTEAVESVKLREGGSGIEGCADG